MTRPTAKRIVRALLTDLADRAGIGDEWAMCDTEVRAELTKTWTDIILQEQEED